MQVLSFIWALCITFNVTSQLLNSLQNDEKLFCFYVSNTVPAVGLAAYSNSKTCLCLCFAVCRSLNQLPRLLTALMRRTCAASGSLITDDVVILGWPLLVTVLLQLVLFFLFVLFCCFLGERREMTRNVLNQAVTLLFF